MLLTSSVRPSVGRALSARVPGVETPTVAEVKLPACRPVRMKKQRRPPNGKHTVRARLLATCFLLIEFI